MGKAAALAFAREGTRLVLAARRRDEGEETAHAARQLGAQAVFVRADVTVEADIRRVIDEAVSRYGRLDVAFNNAGTEGLAAPLAEQTTDNYELVMNTNVKSVLLSMKHEIQAMLKTGGGAIVNNASDL